MKRGKENQIENTLYHKVTVLVLVEFISRLVLICAGAPLFHDPSPAGPGALGPLAEGSPVGRLPRTPGAALLRLLLGRGGVGVGRTVHVIGLAKRSGKPL